jgi:hypothetical protein
MRNILLIVFGSLTWLQAIYAAEWQLTTRGYGPVHAGISIAQASRLMGAKLRTVEGRPIEAACDYLYPASGHKGVSLMVQEGRVTHVLVSTPNIRTRSGIRVGDSASHLKNVFSTQLEIEPHKYDDSGFYYFIWEKGKRLGVKFEIGGGKVRKIFAGDESIQYVEGCS